MKFSSAIEFNAVREWADYYVNYSKLKHLIYDIEKVQADIFRREHLSDEEAGLLWENPSIAEKEADFVNHCEAELERVDQFYKQKEAQLLREVHELMELSGMKSGSGSSAGESTPDSPMSVSGHETDTDLDGSDRQRLLAFRLDFSGREKIAIRCRELYINLCSLKEFIVLNYTAFSKILKKHDKVLDGHLKPQFMERVENSYFWQQNSNFANHATLNDAIGHVVDVFAKICCDGDYERASTDLGQHLREFVVWERNTVWREMIGKQRKVTAAGVKRVISEEASGFQLRLPLLGKILVKRQFITLLLCLAIFGALMAVDLFGDYRKSRCFAILIFASATWATESLPLFVTSMCVPLLLIVTGILVNEETQEPMPAKDAASYISGKMFAPVILLLLGGFSIAAAVSKEHIAKRMATLILSRAGTRSNNILLAIMCVATFASMWLSNVAAPVLCFSVIEPLLRTLEPGNGFAKSLIMGIALSSNIGGMITPISSPQNAIAVETMDPKISWLSWLAVTVPLSAISVVLCWLALLLYYKPSKSTPFVQPIRSTNEPLTRKQYFVLLVTCVTILLWLVESSIREWVGHSGIIGLFPMIIFFGSGVLTKDDFNSFPWTVVMLAMGGISLGAAVKNTLLLKSITAGIKGALANQPYFVALLAFCSVTLVIATFISHTVSAVILLPLVKEVGKNIPGCSSNLLVLGAAIMCSGAMGLPISGFPNITAVSLEDATGEPYVKTKDFLRLGVPMSIVVCILTVSIGLGLMLMAGI